MRRRLYKFCKFKIQFKYFNIEVTVSKVSNEQYDTNEPIGNTIRMSVWDSILSITSSVISILRTIFI